MIKSFHNFTGAFALTLALSVPSTVFSQEPSANTEIVVTGGFQQMWARGSATERAGIAALAKAQGKLAKADRDIADANTRQDHGTNSAENASGEFQQTTANTPNGGDSAEAAKFAKTATANAKRWKKGESEQNRGVADAKKAQKNRQRAEAAIVKAQAQIDAGRAKMAEAQRRSLLSS